MKIYIQRSAVWSYNRSLYKQVIFRAGFNWSGIILVWSKHSKESKDPQALLDHEANPVPLAQVDPEEKLDLQVHPESVVSLALLAQLDRVDQLDQLDLLDPEESLDPGERVEHLDLQVSLRRN